VACGGRFEIEDDLLLYTREITVVLLGAYDAACSLIDADYYAIILIIRNQIAAIV
jgi:hypothetical protein